MSRIRLQSGGLSPIPEIDQSEGAQWNSAARLACLIFLGCIFLLMSNWPSAAVVEMLPRISTVYYVRNNNLTSCTGCTAYTSFYLLSYGDGSGNVTLNDGAAGLFVKGSCGTNSNNGGSVLQDNQNTCFFRQNLNGDLRQWGLTQGSSFDVVVNGTAAADASVTINNAFDALGPLGIKTLHTNGVSLRIAKKVTIPAGSGLTCDTPPVNNAQGADYTRLPGSLVLTHRDGANLVYIDAQANNDAEVYNCAVIIPEWYVNPSSAIVTWTGGKSGFNTHPTTTYADLEAIRTNMITAGDFAIEAGSGAKIHDISIMGFDNCLYLYKASQLLAKNINMDCSIGLYAKQGGGNSDVKDIRNTAFLTRQTGFDNEQYWDITDISANGSGECHVTVHALQGVGTAPKYSVSNLALSEVNDRGDPRFYPGWVTGLKTAGVSCLSAGTGSLGNDAGWWVYGIVAHADPNYANDYASFDLKGSVYATSTAKITSQGDWLANTGVVRLTGPITNLAAGMVATSSDPSWPSGTVTVQGVVQRCTGPDPNDGYNGCVIVSPAPATASTGAVTIQFYNPVDTFTPSTNKCDGDGAGYCFFYNQAQRSISGSSDAGNATARLPASRGGHFGAGFLLDGIAGLRAVDTFSFAHYYGYAAIDSNSCVFFQEGGDNNGELNAGNDTFLYVSGSSRGCTFVGNKNGQSGGSIVLDTFGTADGSQVGTSTSLTGLNTPYVTGVTLSLTGDSALPTRGALHLCKALAMGVCDKAQDNEFVFYSCPTSSCAGNETVNVRARLGTAGVNWSGVTGYVFPATVNGGSTKHPDKTATTIFSDLNNPTTASSANQFEILHGSATLAQVNTTAGGIGFVSTNTSGTTISASNESKVSVYFEDQNARALTTVSPDSSFASFVAQGVLNQPISYRQWFGSPQALLNSGGITSTQIGAITVQDTSNWPQTGVLAADSEYMAFHILNGNTLYVEQRGLCGSSAASHNENSMVSYMNVILGCPDFGQGAPQFTMDASGAVAFAQSALAHGQVYLSLAGANVQLCPRDGKGLIINSALRTVPHNCVPIPTSQTTATNLNFVYAVYHQLAVTSMAGVGSPPHVRMFVTDTSDFYAGTPITCYGMTGTPGANAVEDNQTTKGSSGGVPFIELADITFVASGTGACGYIGLAFNTTGHATANNGVETKNGDPTQTLVGMVYADGSNVVADSATKRDVASWFNRRLKTCIATWGANATVANTGYTELKTAAGNPLHCEFVAWGEGDPAWALFGLLNDTLPNEVASLAAEFDMTPTTELVQWQENNNAQRPPLGLSGSTALSEGLHYITMIGKAPSGTVTVYSGGGEEVRISQ